MAKKFLTNEKIKNKFRSNFALANYAIKVGRENVLGGRFTTLDDLLVEIKRSAELVDSQQEKDENGIA
jgi:hypothetical protein